MNTDDTQDLTREQAVKLTKILKDDVDWILAHRKLKFNPDQGCRFNSEEQEFELMAGECGTCLVGAHMMRHQPLVKDDHIDEDYRVFARDVRCTEAASYSLYMGAMLGFRNIESHPRASLVTGHVLKYALTQGWVPDDSHHDTPYRERLTNFINRCNEELQA